MHRRQLVLRDCVFWVSQNGRIKVQKEKQKNVHAMVRGNLCQEKLPVDLEGWVQVSYDPYRKDVDRFYIKETGLPIDSAKKVIFTPEMEVFAFL